MKIVAVLTTTVLPKDGVYRITTLSWEEVPPVRGVPHYIGHPATKRLVEEELGAVPAPSNLFPGLEPGEAALCLPIAQGRSSRKELGYSQPHQEVTKQDLQPRLLVRLE